MQFDLPRQLAAECLGTLLLVCTVVGSGIMAEQLSGGNTAIALLGNTLPTGAILVVLITVFGPISGAHFNPAVTLVFYLQKQLKTSAALLYCLAQIAGAVLGTLVAHLMFGWTLFEFGSAPRTGAEQWFSEGVATFGLLATILGCVKFRVDAVAYAVGLYITAAYWFTASTSFANPAVTIGRSFTTSFSGIAPGDMPGFIAAQVVGAVLALAVFSWLLKENR